MIKNIGHLVICLTVLVSSLFSPLSASAKDYSRKIDPAAISLPSGYYIEAVVSNLSVPTTAIFDGQDLIIAESGWQNTAKPRVLRVHPNGTFEVLAENGLVGPVTGLLIVHKQLYVSHKGKVSIVQPDKTLKDILTGLPSSGDHQNNNIVLGKDGKIYMGQGTTTNSGVVGEDNYVFGWLAESRTSHEVPCKDITLVGDNFESGNPLTPDKNDKVKTGAYHPFGAQSRPGEVIKGNVKCGGSILRFNPDGSGLEVVAWGMRNPFGLEFDSVGQLWATYHGADVRGSRSIFEDPDYLVKVQNGAWYGWPEFFDGKPVTDPSLKDPTKPQPEFLWQDHPQLSQSFTTFQSHSATNGLAISPSGAFGYTGDAFIAQFGSFLTVTSGVDPRVPGFKIVRVDLQSGEVEDFAKNTLPGPSYINQGGGIDRPSDVVFGPDSSLYIVDWGASTIGTAGLKYVPGSGVVWRIYKDGMRKIRSNGTLIAPIAAVPESQRKADVKNIPELYKEILPPLGFISVFFLTPLVIAGIIIWNIIKHRREKRDHQSRENEE